jgi:hypothetical protein
MNSKNTGTSMPLRQGALSSWENEGGAPAETEVDVPLLSNAELVQLRVRVIALENVIIALLSQGSDEQLRLISEMSTYVLPRPGFTAHPMTIRASKEMLRLVDRATHFRGLAAP